MIKLFVCKMESHASEGPGLTPAYGHSIALCSQATMPWGLTQIPETSAVRIALFQ